MSEKPRGRPRSQDTIERDEMVLERIGSDWVSRKDLADALGVNTNVIYLSLTRLRKAGRVLKVRSGKIHLWARTYQG